MSGDGTAESSDESQANVEFVALASSVALPVDNVDKKGKEELAHSYVSRLDASGNFTYVEDCVEELVGFSAKELLGTSAYLYIHPNDVLKIVSFHQKLLSGNEQVRTPRYRMRTNLGCWFWCQMVCMPVKNPWSKSVEFIVARTEFMQSMSPIPMNLTVNSAEALDLDLSKSATMGLPSLEFSQQNNPLADLLAMTDTALDPFLHDPDCPPELTSTRYSPYSSSDCSPPQQPEHSWSKAAPMFDQTPSLSCTPWAPPLM